MSLRPGPFVLVIWLLALGGALGGCGASQSDKAEPQTAREKQLEDATAKGEVDKPGTKWGGWRYQGDRKDCFYVVGRKCFKTQKAACSTACGKSAAACKTVGGGPATVSCAKTQAAR